MDSFYSRLPRETPVSEDSEPRVSDPQSQNTRSGYTEIDSLFAERRQMFEATCLSRIPYSEQATTSRKKPSNSTTRPLAVMP